MSGGPSSGSQSGQQETSDIAGQLRKFVDPCAAFRQLTDQRQKLVSGGATAEFEYHGNGTQRRIKFSLGNLAALDNDIRQAQGECAATLGMANPNRRFAITAGGRSGVLGVNEGYVRWSARTGYL